MTITAEKLKLMQALPLSEKILLSKLRIKDWYEHFSGKVAVSYSGGKDSSVLLHLVRQLYPDVPAVYCNTGLDYPEVKEHVKSTQTVIILKPEMNFRQVLDSYGVVFPSKDVAETIYYAKRASKWALMRMDGRYSNGAFKQLIFDRFTKWKYLLDAPFKISHMCCDIMKEKPFRKFQKESGLMPFIGLMTSESHRRKLAYLRKGSCNAYDSIHPSSMPLAFWTDQDILLYVHLNNLPIPSVYGDIIFKNGKLSTTGEKRTGCMFCLVGCHLEKPNRFQRMKESHPKHYKYCMEQLGLDKILSWLNIAH